MNILHHKDSQVTTYLEKLSYNQEEKTLLLGYMKENKQGNYLEVGTGGDSLFYMLQNLCDTDEIKIFGCDVSQSVLAEVISRNENIEKYLHSDKNQSLKLELCVANILKLPFKNNFFDGINASALFHEVYSYCGGKKAVETSFSEVYRTLKKGGVFLYRDPKLDRGDEIVTIISKDENFSSFINMFFPYYFSHLVNNNMLKDSDFCNISFILTTGEKVYLMDIEKMSKVPTQKISFGEKFEVVTNKLFASELFRHYITFLVDCNSLKFVEFQKDPLSGFYKVVCHNKKGHNLFNEFIQNYNCSLISYITEEFKLKIDNNSNDRLSFLRYGISVFSNNSKDLYKDLKELLGSQYCEIKEYGMISIDPKIFFCNLNKVEEIIDLHNSIIQSDGFDCVQNWIKREGKESYFYMNLDEIIAEAFLQSISSNSFEMKDPFILVPRSEDYIISVQRNYYADILKRECDLISVNNHLEINDLCSKLIIHFVKIPFNEGILILNTLCRNMNLPNTKELISKFYND